jgi:hypothetical protein
VKPLLRIFLIAIFALGISTSASSQTYVKLNGVYALGGVVNPQVEFALSPHSTFQTEVVYSPWRSIDGHPMHFGILQNEYRYYIKEHNSGLYLGANVALKLFNMSKDDLNFNIAQFDAMRKTAVLTYAPESIDTAFINEDNAQALITMTCRCEDRNTGEVLYYYRTSTTYTMVRDGKWKITLQTPGSEEDLMHTLNTTENDTAQ